MRKQSSLFTVYITTAALWLGTILYKHVVVVLHVSGFFGYFEGGTLRIQIQWLYFWVPLCKWQRKAKTCKSTRLKKSNEMQQYANIYLLLNYSTCFGRPSSGVHKTVVAASGIGHTIWGASFLKSDQIRTGLGPSGPKPVLIWLELQFYVLLMMGARNM